MRWTIPGVLRLGENEEPDSLNSCTRHTAATDRHRRSALFVLAALRRTRATTFPISRPRYRRRATAASAATERRIVLHLRTRRRLGRRRAADRRRLALHLSCRHEPGQQRQDAYGWDEIASASAPDPYTIVIRLRRPSVAGARRSRHRRCGLSAAAGASARADCANLQLRAFNEHPSRAGHILLKEWNHGSSLVFVPNPRYFRGAPKLKEVIWKIIPDVNTLFNQAGDPRDRRLSQRRRPMRLRVSQCISGIRRRCAA